MAPAPSPNQNIQNRKDEHINYALKLEKSSNSETWLDCVKLIHNALPDVNFSELSTSTNFLGKTIDYPIIIDAMTGGTAKSQVLNEKFARIASKFNIAMSVGSQRVLFDHPKIENSFGIVRKYAPHQPILANIGISEIIKIENLSKINHFIESIKADGLYVHLNSLQELIQPQGNRDFKNATKKLQELQSILDIPIIIKEVGMGLSKEIILKLRNLGFQYFNVAGYGGTNFALIEAQRAQANNLMEYSRLGNVFSTWGIPTAACIFEAFQTLKQQGWIIASGGIRTGLDIGISLSLGANLCGIALPFLREAEHGLSAIETYVSQLILELKTCMFVCGINSIKQFPKVQKVILPPLQTWIQSRGFKG
jgi:isopentenyl-diphosphate delta-isomerase